MLRLACDVGGTFTDLIVASEAELRLYKAATTIGDPAVGVLAAIGLAASDAGLDQRAFLGRVDTLVHATTRAINAILTGNTAKTAFLTTEGHRDILLLREGGRMNPYDNRQEFPRPYIPRALTFEIPERVGAAGEVVRPLDEAAARAILTLLAEARVEAVAVCLLWSIANPSHEKRMGELICEHLPGVPFTLSHQLNPIIREYRRASATCIDASLKPLMGRYLAGLAGRLRDAGFGGRSLMVTSQGGVIEAAEAAEAPIHALNSGPSMAPVVGRHIARRDAASGEAIIADAGGTSFDVSLVRDGRIPWTSETWLGARFSSHMTGFPSVDVKSIGAGGGSIVRLDEAGLLHVGPASAGAEPGPVCYGRSGTKPTVTDCALVLGWLDAANFLGGRLRLDTVAARNSLEETVAGPLGITVEAAAHSALEILTQNMLGAIEEITVKQGIDPARTVLVAGGGAAGFNAAAIGRRLDCRATLFPEVGAALCAAGAMLSDLVFSDARVHYLRSDAPDPAAVARLLDELAASAARFLGDAAGSATETDFWVEARYPQQTWEIEVPLKWPLGGAPFDLARLTEAFHAAHKSLYAVSDTASPVEFIAWRVRASARLGVGDARPVAGSTDLVPRQRRIWIGDEGWADVPLLSFAAVPEVSPVAGPAIIESSFTTVVIPTGCSARRLPSGTVEVRS